MYVRSFCTASIIFLSEVVSQGVRYGGGVSNLDPGLAGTVFLDLNDGQHCGAAKAKATSKSSKMTDNEIHEMIQQRVEDLVGQANSSLDPDTICIRSKLDAVAASAELNIHLEVEANFNSILPMFNGIVLRAQATGPYLFPSG